MQGHIKGIPFPVLLAKPVITHKDGRVGVLDRVSRDLGLDDDRLTAIYQKRWNIEVFHQSTPSNTGLARSPTHTVRTQRHHLFASIQAFFKHERLKLKHQMTPFALKSKRYVKALQANFSGLLRNVSDRYLFTEDDQTGPGEKGREIILIAFIGK